MSFKYFLLDTYLNLDYEVHVACKEYQGSNLYHNKINYHFIDFERNLSIKSTLISRKQLLKLVKDLKPALIHAHFSSSIFLLAISKQKNFPHCIGTIQGSLFLATHNWIKKQVFKMVEIFSIRRLNEVFVLTDDDFVALRKKSSNISLQKARGFGVNLEFFNNRESNAINRGDLGIEKDDRVLVYVGRLVSFKGFNLVLNIFHELCLKNSGDYKLIVCGKFDKFHKSKFSKNELDIFNDNPNIIKVGFTDDVRSYLAMSDLNIFPSKREGYPVNVMESIAMELPTITSNYRGCRHVIIPLINGIVVGSDNVDIWVDQIGEMFTFTLIRDPYERLVSAWRYARSGGTNEGGVKNPKYYQQPVFEKFDDFVQKWLVNQDLEQCELLFRTQCSFIKSKMNVDVKLDAVYYLDRTDELESKLSEILNRHIELPKKNVSKINSKNTKLKPEPKTLSIIHELYYDDYKEFNFDKPILND